MRMDSPRGDGNIGKVFFTPCKVVMRMDSPRGDGNAVAGRVSLATVTRHENGFPERGRKPFSVTE